MDFDMDALQEYAMSWVAYFKERPMMLLSVFMMIYRVYNQLAPMPDHGGKLTAVTSGEELEAELSGAEKKGEVVVLDVYATWCGPCKKVAPTYARMSEEAEMETVRFLKCDGDKSRALLQRLGVKAFPTFLVWAGRTAEHPLRKIEGADVATIREAIAEAKEVLAK